MEYNDTSSNDTSEGLQRLKVEYWEQVFTALIILLIAVIGIIGNSMIIIAVAFSHKLQTSTNAFVTSLSISDLMTSLFLIWLTVSVLGRNGWPLPRAKWICWLTGFVIYTCRGTSLYTLAAIAVNRLILITKPSLYRKIFTSWKLRILIAIPWIIVAGSIIILLVTGMLAFGYDKGDLTCGIVDSAETVFLVITLIALPIPLLVITVSYTGIYIYLKRYFRAKKRKLPASAPGAASVDAINMSGGNIDTPSSGEPGSVLKELASKAAISATQREKIAQKQIEITKNLFLAVCSVFLCFLPYFVLIFVPNSVHIQFYTDIITIANSSINFAIYACKHPDFKVVFGHLYRRSYSDIPQPSRLLRFLLSKGK